MKKFSAVFLFVSLVATISVMWVKAKWATTIPEVAGFTLAAAWAVLFLTGRVRPRLNIALAPFAGVLMWGGMQLLLGTTVYRWPTRLALLYWAGNLAVFFCGLQVFADKQIRALFLKVLMFFGFGLCILSVLQALTSPDKIYWYFPLQDGPAFGPFLYENQFAAFIELVLPIALYLAVTTKKRRILYYLVTATLYASVIASTSRAGFILATIELALVPVLASQRKSLSGKPLLNGALVMIGMLLWLAIPAGPDALITKFGLSDPFSGRREFNQSSLQMIRARPLVGFGMGNWPIAYPGYALFDDGRFANQAHNDWAQWAVEGGIPLAALMLWLAIWGGVRGFRSGWGVGVPMIFLHCFVDYPIQRPGVGVVFFLMLAAVAGSGARASERPVEYGLEK
jgi:O-antigen ligase